jgi:hypothetical protein
MSQRYCYFWYTLENIMSNSNRPTLGSMIKFNQTFNVDLLPILSATEILKFTAVGRRFNTTNRSRDAFVTTFERIVLKIRCRAPIAWPSRVLQVNYLVKKIASLRWLRVWIGCHRVTFGRNRTCFGCWLADYQFRGHLREKFKIPYSHAHLVSISWKCDACTNKIHSINIDLLKNDTNSLTQEKISLATVITSYKMYQYRNIYLFFISS